MIFWGNAILILFECADTTPKIINFCDTFVAKRYKLTSFIRAISSAGLVDVDRIAEVWIGWDEDADPAAKGKVRQVNPARPRLPRLLGSGRRGLAQDYHLLARPDLHQLDFQDSIGQRGVHFFRVDVGR